MHADEEETGAGSGPGSGSRVPSLLGADDDKDEDLLDCDSV